MDTDNPRYAEVMDEAEVVEVFHRRYPTSLGARTDDE